MHDSVFVRCQQGLNYNNHLKLGFSNIKIITIKSFHQAG